MQAFESIANMESELDRSDVRFFNGSSYINM